MLNPFVVAGYPGLEKDPRIAREAYRVEDQGLPNYPSTPWHQVTVGLGKVLIGLGNRLAEEEARPYAPGTLAS